MKITPCFDYKTAEQVIRMVIGDKIPIKHEICFTRRNEIMLIITSDNIDNTQTNEILNQLLAKAKPEYPDVEITIQLQPFGYSVFITLY